MTKSILFNRVRDTSTFRTIKLDATKNSVINAMNKTTLFKLSRQLVKVKDENI